jgi:hypothetical protein
MRAASISSYFIAAVLGSIVPSSEAPRFAAPPRSSDPEFPSKPTRQDLQRLYVEYLSDQGYKPEVDGDGDVVFRAEGISYCISVDEKDIQYFRVVCPNYWKIESDDERAEALEALSHSNARCKVAKSYILRGQVWSSVEIFVERPTAFKVLFARSLSALQFGVRTFADKMRE